jgi:uncharacterized protein Smg (DUF494 family)
MQRLVVDTDALAKKLQERGYSPTEIATAMEVLKELDDASQTTPQSPSSNT